MKSKLSQKKITVHHRKNSIPMVKHGGGNFFFFCSFFFRLELGLWSWCRQNAHFTTSFYYLVSLCHGSTMSPDSTSWPLIIGKFIHAKITQRWLWHALRMSPERIPKVALRRTPPGKWKRDQPKITREQNCGSQAAGEESLAGRGGTSCQTAR